MVWCLKYVSAECWWHRDSVYLCVRERAMQVRPQLGSNKEIKPRRLQIHPLFSDYVGAALQKQDQDQQNTRNIQIQTNVLCCYRYMVNLPGPAHNAAWHTVRHDH